MMKRCFFLTAFSFAAAAQEARYPQGYFRHPLEIPMQLVANFGEIRTNHWHMGLDIRTQQRVNLPVYASAEGYISRVSVEPGGFGQAIYITHPNGFTTLYAHLNAFFPALATYVKQQQYVKESWRVNLLLSPGQFPVKKGDFIAYSGSTGASEGPHVHFEIRDTQTDECLNPLLFRFPIPDAVPPTITRLALYDRNRSTWMQKPQILSIRGGGGSYSLTAPVLIVGSNRVSFALGATDRFSATPNPNGIFAAETWVDGQRVGGFEHDSIDYADTRYINAQLDYPYKTRGGGSLQHLAPLPGANSDVAYGGVEGLILLQDTAMHKVELRVFDAAGNRSTIRFQLRYNPELATPYPSPGQRLFLPNNVNIFEEEFFELFTTERTLYDTIPIRFTATESALPSSLSPAYSILGSDIPAHDSITVRIRINAASGPSLPDKVVIRNTVGSRTYLQRANYARGWFSARFRQFGAYQVFIDNEPPTVNNPPANLAGASRLVFTPKDNFKVIRSFRLEVDGQWLRCSNDKGVSWVYVFDEYFPKGQHELKAIIEDEAGNVTEKTWTVQR